MQTAKRTIWEIGDELRTIEDALYEAGGDVSEQDAEAALDEWLSSVLGDLSAKVEAYAAMRENISARMAQRRMRIAALADMVAVEERAIERMDGRMMEFMRQHDIKRINHGSGYVLRRGNGGVAPLELDPWYAERPERLPKRFQRVHVAPDNAAIREALDVAREQDGAEVLVDVRFLDEGDTHPIARILPRGEHLQWR